MQIRYPPAVRLLLVFSFLVLSKGQDVIGSKEVSCFTWSTGEDGLTRVTFLAPDTAGVRSLYITQWSVDMRLVTCEVNTNPLTTDRYLDVCDRSGTRDQEIRQRFNISALLVPEAPCALVSSSASELTKRATSDGTEGKTRRKRSWIFPGTLWCGTGSRADIYDQLGMFESTDRCCREHDHCRHVIPAFTVNYGVFNQKFFTVSHCDCDQRFRQCLLQVNDSISSMVGYSFFNILQVPCFELQQRQRCSQMYWWGMCKRAKRGPYAIFKDPLPFNTTEALSQYEDSNPTSSDGQHVTESPVINSHITSPRGGHRCSSEKPPRDNPFYHRGRKGKGCKRRRKLFTAAAPSQSPSTSTAHTTSPSMETSSSHSPKTSTIMTNKKRAGKKNTRKDLPVYPTHSGQVVKSSYPQTSSTTHGTPSTTQTPAPQLYSPTAITAITKTSRPRKKNLKNTNCCGHRTPPRGDTFQPHCRSCQEQKPTPHLSTVTLSMTTQVTTPETTNGPKQGTWSTDTSSAAATTKPKKATSSHKDEETQKQMNSHQLLWNNTTVKLRTKAPKPHKETGLKMNISLHNITDSQRLCGNLKVLDDCKFKIAPLETKYSLQNTESKTAYHCDCTRRLAAQIKSFKQPGILPTLLMDFVSQRCFKLPKEKKCHGKKSCSGGFTKASGLLQVLKKMEEKDIAGVLNSGNGRKRGIPVRLYKRCLRLEREADIMAQLTRL